MFLLKWEHLNKIQLFCDKIILKDIFISSKPFFKHKIDVKKNCTLFNSNDFQGKKTSFFSLCKSEWFKVCVVVKRNLFLKVVSYWNRLLY